MPFLNWLKNSPYYEFSGSDKNILTRNGFWGTARPYYVYFVRTIYSTFSSTILKNRIFPKVSDQEYETYCRMTAQLRDVLKIKKPKSAFVFYVHPFANLEPRLRACLEQHKITIAVGKKISPEFQIKYDGHPNSQANKEIAAELLQIAKSIN